MEQAAILIVDDDRNLTKTLADILAAKGYAVLAAEDGAAGLALLRTNNVDLALIDLGLPDIPGLDLLSRIKMEYPATAVIILTETELEPCREIRSGECLCGQALATGEIVITTNSDIDVRHRKCSPVVHPHGHIIVPLKTASGTGGLLNLFIEPETEINNEMLNLLTSIASQMGVAINNARLYEETKTFSLQDPLTGLANRRFMEIQLDKSLEMAKRYQEELSVIMLDIDFFKDYNDAHGHLEGDKLLIRLADIFRREVRKADYVFRYGGEEFLIILPETDPGMARDAAERLREAVEVDGEGVTISLGVASLCESPGQKRQLIDAADNALYRAKQNGRNRVETS